MQITIFWQGKYHNRAVEKAPQFTVFNRLYIVDSKSKGLSFWFRKEENHTENNGWQLVYGGKLPDDIISVMAVELEKIYREEFPET